MKILIEGEKYNLNILLEVFDDLKFFIQEGIFGIVNCVGYYYLFIKNELIYIFLKVFIKEGKVFNFFFQELFELDLKVFFNYDKEYFWVR